MAYAQTIIDSFSTTTLSSVWTTPDGATGITAGGSTLTLSALSSYPDIDEAAHSHDLTNGILAVKLSSSGTATASTQFFFGINDSAGNEIDILTTPSSPTYWTIESGGATTVSAQGPATGAYLWSGWTSGNWFGIGNIGSDNVVHFYKSTDGQTWTPLMYATVGGTFIKTATGLSITAGCSGTSTWKAILDDASYFANAVALPGKVRVGAAWVTPSAVKVRVGGAWVTPSAIKVRQGGVWVTPSA